jgi:hypothetical protein
MTPNLIGKILALCFWGLFLLVGAELASRYVLFPQYTAMLPDMYFKHPDLGHFNKPNIEVRRYSPMNWDTVNHTNALGLRGLNENLENELAGIWVAGSSNTFGGYVEDDQLFAAQLNKRGYWAANLASENHFPADQAMVIRYLGDLGYRPRAVILSLPMFHAVQDYSGKYDVLTRPLKAIVPEAGPADNRPRTRLLDALDRFSDTIPRSMQSVRARLLKSSALYGYLKVGIMGIPALRQWTLDTGLRTDVDIVYNFSLDLMRPLGADNPQYGKIESTLDFVAAVRDMVRDRFDVPFGIVLTPTPHQIHPETFQRYVSHFGLEYQDLDPTRLADALMAGLEKRNVPVLDTVALLRAANTERLTFPDDGHLNARGHAIVGNGIADWLASGMGTGQTIEKDR